MIRLSLMEFVHDRYKLFSRGLLVILLISAVQALNSEQIILSSNNKRPIEFEDGHGQRGTNDVEGSFRLRHVLHHGAERYPNLLRRLDVDPSQVIWNPDNEPTTFLTAKSRIIDIRRMQDRSLATIETHLSAARNGQYNLWNNPASAWVVDQIVAPDITDKETVLNLAKMAANAYVRLPATEDWRDVGAPWNASAGFGWENDGLRGHIYLDEKNTTVIISIKGTSVAVFYGEETKTNDKINDNLFFSCCCARVSAFWRTVCDCYTDTYSCSSTCITEALKEENRYYRAALNLYYNVTKIYPDSEVWVVGHSLGGSVSSLLGQTYGLPVVTFEAPPEALPAARVGIPSPPGNNQNDGLSGVYHFGNNADPIYMGVCNGATSFCSLGGYAMETKCHTGNICVYDVVNDLGWRVNGNAHRIKTLIDEVISKYDKVPECVPEDNECTDCFNWNFHNGSVTTTTTSKKTTTTTSSRSTTCQHPGWWGCLDETTTTTTTSSSTQSTSSTTVSKTCTHYGWFGDCLDSKTSTSTSTSTSGALTSISSPSKTTPITMVTSISFSSPTGTSTKSVHTTSCQTPGYFWGCRDQ